MPTSLPPVEYSLPCPDELEVSIFGAHYGESIVVHLNTGKWMIVDSCRCPATKKSAAYLYLTRLGVDLAKDVQLIVITHWHDDHIQGISDLVDACHSARVYFSSALIEKEFLTLVSTYSGENSIVDRSTSGTREMADTIRVLRDRILPNSSTSREFLIPVTADRILVENEICSIRSLSPSDKSYHQAIAHFKSLIPSEKSERTTLQAPSANDVSIVLWLSCQKATVLLGSDLEETGDAQTGWQAIVNSPVKLTGKANIFKIPHHGSITGHSDDVWESMVEKDALCLMTENTRGNYSIPKSEDVDRIRKYSSNLFCTSLPKQKLKKRDNAVERTLRGMVANRKSLGGNLGHIQVRITAEGETRVNSQEPACKLRE